MTKRISLSQIRLVHNLRLKKYRDLTHLFVAEGDKCIGDLLPAFEPKLLINYDNQQYSHCSVYATDKDIRQLSSLRTPQGSIGVFLMPDWSALPPISTHILAIDGVQDPGNLGTILRTCDWFGIYHVVCSTHTVDCFSPKVVQATMGSLARVQVHYTHLPQWLQQVENHTAIYGTLLDGDNLLNHHTIPNASVIIMGNEGNGISNEVRPFIAHPIRIPSFVDINHLPTDAPESLNVATATAVILSYFRLH